ncbi:MAG: CapA family protein, partial [Clostridia bacterium]|nr:CapA family protein [Clostridia bacterium]
MKIFAVGDICPTGKTWDLFKNGDIDALFGNTIEVIRAHDFAIANLECAITEADKGIEKFGPCLKAPIESAKTLKNAGFTALSISNNHFFDFGKKGALDSLSAINEAGLLSVGFGKNYEASRKNLVIEKDGERVCIIDVCEHEYSYALDDRMGARPYDEYDTMDDIRNAKKDCDRVIVLYH